MDGSRQRIVKSGFASMRTDPQMQMRHVMAMWLGHYVVRRRKRPSALWGFSVQKPMIAQMVIIIVAADVKHHSGKKFSQPALQAAARAVTAHCVGNVHIGGWTVCPGTASAEHGQRGYKRNARTGCADSIKASHQHDIAVAKNSDDACRRRLNAA